MANTAEVINFPVPDVAPKEPRVADLDDGYTRLANELLDAVMCSGLPETELCILMAVWRKTYGYNKKMDWISNEQLEEMIQKHHTHCSTAKNSLIRKKVLIQEGRRVGMNIHISEWQTKNNGFCKTLAKPAKKTLAEVANAPKQKLLTTKDKLTKDNIKRSTSENSDESSDKPRKKPHVLKPEAAIQRGNKWGTAEDLTAAEWMFDLIKTISPSARKPNLAGWANDIRLMRECDGRTHRDMCVLFRWACHDSFWAGNVISPAKLREKWTQLDINRNKQQTGTTASKSKLDLNNTDWIYGVEL
ncbi:Replication protein O [Salmonella enterica subsp. enterica serovar Litchfield]|uniref:Replication protein O n=9 Tax=root TaxID=1 RepID=A0A0M5M7Y1_9CAUD|nr:MULTISPECIES: replication protein [Salmonella]YP_009191652.1 replication initiation O-like [Salmonella phage SEN34]EAA2148580.1 Replication protein O [Salmonella enterica subsp. enterica serovar Saintpaul]EAA3206403.1 Replication protein O [Salmonella enterica subsp. enterica serovar Hadar]EBG0719992.1 Replication protein O [Salmonella enterica subsp. enterica serovar Bredeney]EBG7954471.1 Replication protein O [Salmonella enterica subsp. enterica serovar Heidelberg]EBM0755216.1 replicatio